MKRNDDPFASRLREAATAVTPATSETLHARVMGDVRRERSVASSAAEAPLATRWWWTLGAAAATAVTVGVLLMRTTTPPPGPTPPNTPVQIAELPPMPSIESVVVETVGPVRDKLHEARFAYLDRDAMRLARFLIRAVPGVPTGAKEPARRL